MRINEKGRSMIEMLGVLAIIGVLSVGGIAGYSKAMAKFRANKTIDLVAHTVANTRILFGSQGSYTDLDTGDGIWSDDVKTLAWNAKLFPDENLKNEGTAAAPVMAFKNAYAGEIFMYSGQRLQTDAANHKAFVLVLTGLPQSACIDLATQDWAASSGSGFVSMAVSAGSSTEQPDDATTFTQLLNDSHYVGSCATANQNGVSYLCGSDNEAMSTILATQGCTDPNFNNIYLKFF